MNDREAGPRETTQVEVAFGFCINCLQHHQIIGDGVLALLPNVRA